ncbi:TIGR02281 family clan AA aspartic protease [Phyllobacterium sophorae]|jgi:aspartyl protease family protein|uniref:TIGR02281 family clan AA aspartic protease n=1 Tax=Phyllobacterium sophorae TaxID=1520277 RepID=A0A2P7BHW6_9HYPH|nr:TIGR02281 family clan AA aspartic protease [Phyllobacterium sophorae]PSH66039.1 TIGR02281 family clan AA aspartic protease [Phyllobacterium sophorae]
MSRLFWIIIALIGGTLLLLMANSDSGSTLGMANDDFARLAYMGIWGIVLASALLGSGIPLSHFLRSIAIWIIIILALVAGYQYRYELQDVGHRITAGLIPGSPISNSNGDGLVTVTLAKADNGHFEVRGEVNGATVPFMIDTGASSIVLSADDARRAGFNPDKLSYRTPIMTANGMTTAANVTLDSIKIGAIERRNIRAMVTEDGRMAGSLLGMNFLNTLSGFSVRGDRLVLSD